jgi:hypothetical protein
MNKDEWAPQPLIHKVKFKFLNWQVDHCLDFRNDSPNACRALQTLKNRWLSYA